MKSVLKSQSKHMIAWPSTAMIVSLCTQSPAFLVSFLKAVSAPASAPAVQFNDTRINRNEDQLM